MIARVAGVAGIEQLLAHMNIGVMPAFLFVNAGGAKVAHLVGLQSAEALLAAAARTGTR